MPAVPSVAAILDYLESFAPARLAAEWDNVGLLLGDRTTRVKRLMTCLTVTPSSAAEAVEGKVQLVITHHPILFRGTKRLTTANPEGRMLLSLIRAGVSVYSPHTAFDNTAGGINDALAAKLGLLDVVPLRKGEAPQQYKVVVFVPDTDLDRVSEAMFAAGAGRIGEYSQCSFRLPGTGTFLGSESANPTVGEKGRREEVREIRLEVICLERSLEPVLSALRRAHSYEEPAFDVYPLWSGKGPVGEGRLGRLPQPTSLDTLAHLLKKELNVATIQVVGASNSSVQRIALVCGAGGEFFREAVRARADVFLTGEMRFHDYLSAESEGIALLLPGHYATERFGIEMLAARLQEQWPQVEVWPSRQERDPVTWM